MIPLTEDLARHLEDLDPRTSYDALDLKLAVKRLRQLEAVRKAAARIDCSCSLWCESLRGKKDPGTCSCYKAELRAALNALELEGAVNEIFGVNR